MSAEELCFLSIARMGQLIREKKVSALELVKAHLDRIERTEPTLNAFITVLAEEALQKGREAESEIQSGNLRGPLHGVPFALKDLYATKGIRTTSGVRIFHDHHPHSDSTLGQRLESAGAILLGKLNMNPLAYGPTGENTDYGDVHNPWHPERMPGGSSSGSGSAVAARQAALALGSDTGGSVRIPSALCGLVGLKPTYGRLSLSGLTPLSWSMDHPGPLVRNVQDCALVMEVLGGHDPGDPFSANRAVPKYREALDEPLCSAVVGVPREILESPLHPEVEGAFRQSLERIQELGLEVREIGWPLFTSAAGISLTILMTEASAYHADLIRRQAAQLPEAVRLRLEAGFFISGVEYVRAQRARGQFVQQSREILQRVDFLASPSVLVPACPLGTPEVQAGNQSLDTITALTQLTRPFNVNGFPALTVPCGFSEEGLPIGLQLASLPFQEPRLLQLGHAYQQVTDWHQRHPQL